MVPYRKGAGDEAEESFAQAPVEPDAAPGDAVLLAQLRQSARLPIQAPDVDIAPHSLFRNLARNRPWRSAPPSSRLPNRNSIFSP